MNDDWKIVATQKLPPMPDLNVKIMCPECKRLPPNIVEEFADGDLVCGDCGLVLGDRIVDTRSEWRTFSNEDEDPSRVGGAANPLLEGTQLDTRISKRDGGSGISKTLARAHGRASANKGERNLVEAYKDIASMCDHAGFSKVIADSAKHIYKKARDFKVSGIKEDALIAACLMQACRHEQSGRTFKEIGAITRVKRTELGRAYKALCNAIQTSASAFAFASTPSADLVPRFCSRLKLPQDVIKIAVSVSRKIEELGILAGRSPVTVAASSIFIATMCLGRPKSLREIAHESGITDTTIRGAYRTLYSRQKEWLNAINCNAEALVPPSNIFH